MWVVLAFVAVVGFVWPVRGAAAAEAPPLERNVILHVVPREALFFSAQSGVWTSVRLEAG